MPTLCLATPALRLDAPQSQQQPLESARRANRRETFWAVQSIAFACQTWHEIKESTLIVD